MRINITQHQVDEVKLKDTARNFEVNCGMRPYLIMSEQTLKALAYKGMTTNSNGSYNFHEWDVLINENLEFGDVDIR